jgi:uncharacterized protein YndB with AHSA1/START domain
MNNIKIETIIHAKIDIVWRSWTEPGHIVNWNFASPDWRCPIAANDLKPGGRFSWRMEAKDGSMGFDYAGTYVNIQEPESIEKKLDDGRKINISFIEQQGTTKVIESFEPDDNDPELQRQGWQAILDNFKKYVELKLSS